VGIRPSRAFRYSVTVPDSRMLEDSYERLLRHGLRDGSGVIDAALDRERESDDREKRDRCAWRRLRDGTSKR
jgi:hypothetical protein